MDDGRWTIFRFVLRPSSFFPRICSPEPVHFAFHISYLAAVPRFLLTSRLSHPQHSPRSILEAAHIIAEGLIVVAHGAGAAGEVQAVAVGTTELGTARVEAAAASDGRHAEVEVAGGMES